MDVKVSPAQESAIRKMLGRQWDCSYGWKIPLRTLLALQTRGLVEMRNEGALGSVYSPRTTIEFRIVQHAPEFVLKMAGIKAKVKP